MKKALLLLLFLLPSGVFAWSGSFEGVLSGQYQSGTDKLTWTLDDNSWLPILGNNYQFVITNEVPVITNNNPSCYELNATSTWCGGAYNPPISTPTYEATTPDGILKGKIVYLGYVNEYSGVYDLLGYVVINVDSSGNASVVDYTSPGASSYVAVIYPTPALVSASSTVQFNIEYYNPNGDQDTLTLVIRDSLGNSVVSTSTALLSDGSTHNFYYDFTGNASTTYPYDVTAFLSYQSPDNPTMGAINILYPADRSQQYFSIYALDPIWGKVYSTSTEPEARECSLSDLSGCVYNALVWAFYPTGDTFSNYVALKDTIFYKAPLGYFTLARTALVTIATSSEATFDIEIPEGYKTNIFNPIDLGLTALLWLFFVVQVYKFLKNAHI